MQISGRTDSHPVPSRCILGKLLSNARSKIIFPSGDKDEVIPLTKLDAARKQLQVAIELWFTGGDPVAVHTLAAAAHEIIHVLFRKSGQSGLLFDSEFIKDKNLRNEVNRSLKSIAAFFKHADKDTDAEFAFRPAINEALLVYSVSGLLRMRVKPNPIESAFIMWLWVHRTEWFSEIKPPPSGGFPVEALEYLRTIDKFEFFKSIMLRIEAA